jgi:hypothetical protein
MHAAKQSADASRDKDVHESKAAPILNEGDFEFGAGDRGSPGILLSLLQRKGADFQSSQQPNGWAEENSKRAAEDEQQGAGIADGSALEFHLPRKIARRMEKKTRFSRSD